jgi:hypothetical protein
MLLLVLLLLQLQVLGWCFVVAVIFISTAAGHPLLRPPLVTRAASALVGDTADCVCGRRAAVVVVMARGELLWLLLGKLSDKTALVGEENRSF